MAISIKWFIPQRVILLTLEGEIVSDDFEGLGDTLKDMLAEGTAPVHLIADSSRQESPLLDMKFTRTTFSVLNNEKFGWAIGYGSHANKLISFMSSAISQMLGIRYRAFETEQEAIAFLQEQDDTLDLSDAVG